MRSFFLAVLLLWCIFLSPFAFQFTRRKYQSGLRWCSERATIAPHASSPSGKGNDKACDKPSGMPQEPTSRILNWNLTSLLHLGDDSSPQLIPLVKVFNAASIALAETRSAKKRGESLAYEGHLPAGLTPFRRFIRRYTNDMGHDGRFTVFEGGNIERDEPPSLQSGLILSMDNPLEFLRTHLTYKRKDDSPTCSLYDGTEVVVFLPGLHTSHTSASESLQYYSHVLDGLPIANLHCGTYNDPSKEEISTNITINITQDTLHALCSFNLLKECNHDNGLLPPVDRNTPLLTCQVRSKDLDVIRVILSSVSESPFPAHPVQVLREPQTLKESLIRLIDVATRSAQMRQRRTSPANEYSDTVPHLVLIGYSATTNVVSAALSAWKRQAMVRMKISAQAAEYLLQEAVTVVTINSLLGKSTAPFCDGPSYLHISMIDDLLAKRFGVTESKGNGGTGAVYLTPLSPYYKTKTGSPDDKDSSINTHDSHNMAACSIQYLSLVMRINGVQSFRQMLHLARDPESLLFPEQDFDPSLFALNYGTKVGQLEMPPLLDGELLPAMIRATGGERWLWDPKLQLGDDGVDSDSGDDDVLLPSMTMAEAILTDQFGYDFFDEIVDTCRTSQQ